MPNEINYRDLLSKYMKVIIGEEGVSYLDYAQSKTFTDEEWEVLRDIEAELLDD